MGVKIKGLKKVLVALDRLPQVLENEINLIIEDNARQMSRSAQRFAPYDTGELKRSIKAARNGDMAWRVVVLAKHGPYMEFGTGGLVRVPDELLDVAILYKGRGVKNIDLRPQPYLYPAFELQRDQYVKDLKDLLEQESKKI